MVRRLPGYHGERQKANCEHVVATEHNEVLLLIVEIESSVQGMNVETDLQHVDPVEFRGRGLVKIPD